MNSYDKRLVERLRNWEKVYPEDEDKPEGNLYLEAAERIVELSNYIPEESKMYQTETIAQNVDGLTLISLKYSLQVCKANRDELNKKRDMKGWNAGNQEDWNTVVQDIHALERVIEFYGG